MQTVGECFAGVVFREQGYGHCTLCEKQQQLQSNSETTKARWPVCLFFLGLKALLCAGV